MMVTAGGVTRTHVYTYDNIYQITNVDYPPELSYLATDTEFHYDAAGNRTSVIDGGGTTPYSTNNLNEYTSADGVSYQYDSSGNMTHDETYAYGYDPENRLVKVRQSGPYGTLTLGEALDSPLTYTTGGSGNWTTTSWGEGHDDNNSAYSPSLAVGQESWLQTQVQGAGTISFWAKMTSYDSSNELKFYIDDTLRYGCESEEWDQFSWEVTGAGAHTLKWVYERDSETSSSTGYVDDVGWTGALPAVPPPEPAATNWRYLEYTYDVSGRRIEKKYDEEVVTKYVYDGDRCIAEYNAYNQLKRKYIYGPGVDEPVCMIDTMTSPPVTSYYHFDALGSVVALTNASGNTVEVYEYDVYGRVGATDESHPNRFMFTGREFDKETGLYYYRARCYNSSIGRFLQTDTIGYKDGLNLYAYCHNNPGNRTDPYGTRSWLYGAGHITIESSCAGAKMAILPEDNGSWIADPNAGQDYEADAVGWYTPDGNQVGIKVPDNCELVISCEPVIGEPDKLWVNWHWTCTGLLASPSDVTPGDGPWPPALPPEEKVHVRIAKQEDKTT
jgi:RHS repeat-associated protein